MANVVINAKCNTKLAKGGEKVSSVVSIEMDDEKAIHAFAVRSAIIAWQAMVRDAGTIPPTDKVLISELAKRSGTGGFKVTPDSIARKTLAMPDDQYRATLLALGISEREVDIAMKRRASKPAAEVAPVTPAAKSPAKKK